MTLALSGTLCRRSQHEVAQLIAGPSPAFICDECTMLCAKIVEKKRAANPDGEADP